MMPAMTHSLDLVGTCDLRPFTPDRFYPLDRVTPGPCLRRNES